MEVKEVPFSELLSEVIDNRGKTCPTVDVGIPLIATNCMRNELLYPTYEKARFVSQDTYSTWFRGHPKPGDILFVNKATPGRVCLVPDPVDFCIAQDMVAVRADPKKIYPRFLFAVLRSPLVQERIEQMHVGTLIPHFKKGDFDKLLVPVPGRGAQEFIGDIYFELSAKIDLNRRMNETLEAIARALFKSWFVDFDPVRAKAEGRDPGLPKPIADLFPDSFEDSELGEIPNGWEVGTLADYAELNPESWSKDTAPDEIEYVDLANTKWGKIETTQRHFWGDAPSRAQRILRPGDTVVGTVRPGNGSFAFISDPGLTGSTGFAVLRPRMPAYRELVYLAATTQENIERLSHLADGAAYPAVRPEVVIATQAVRPNHALVERFALSTAPLIARVAVNGRESRTLAALRDTLLPKLISGELRVNGAEPYIAEAMR
jgi:type I restriction enzyme S subunit